MRLLKGKNGKVRGEHGKREGDYSGKVKDRMLRKGKKGKETYKNK